MGTNSSCHVSSYGDIMKVQTSGALKNNLGCSGVQASCNMAQADEGRLNNYKSIITNVGRKYSIDPALIAAIISRESKTGENMGKAWELMQVYQNQNPQGAWVIEEHLDQGTKNLADCIAAISRECSSWNKEQQLKGGIAAYNAGVNDVLRSKVANNVDEYTTGGDFSNDVIARAKWYKHRGF